METLSITDSKKRVLEFRRLSPLEHSRLTLVVGPEAAVNQAYMSGFALPACGVRSIDGEKIVMPASKRELEALIQRLGDEGMGAILERLVAEAQARLEAEEALKNSEGTPNL